MSRTPSTTDRSWRRVLVYGLGLSGRAAARLLLDRGREVVAVDRRSAEELELVGLADRPGFELAAGAEPDALPVGIDAVVISPGVPLDKPLLADARRRQVPILAEVELAFPYLRGPIIGITGSNGKSTTTALTGALLEAAGLSVEVCGNIGEPLSGKVDGPADRVFVVELSSFQLETIDHFRPRAAALLNIAPDHLDRYPGLPEYAEAKRNLFRNQDADDVAVVNADDPLVAETVVRARRRAFSRRGPVSDGCYLQADRVVEVAPGEPPTELFRRTDLLLPGLHNLENAMAAMLLARSLGSEPEELRQGLSRFRGLPHRLEPVLEADGVRWFDDSKGTNPAATIKSLEGFEDGSVHLILGGRAKGSDPRELADAVRRKARRIYCIGEAGESFRDALADVAETELSETLDRAVASAAGRARSGEAVVLSPACASFDQFRGFSHRGEVFQGLVRAAVEGTDG